MQIRPIYALLLASLFVLFSCTEDTIQPQAFGTIVGEVVRKDDLTPINGVAVNTTPTTSSILTDAFGGFVLEDVPAGTYSVRAEKDGFVTKLEGVTVSGSNESQLVIRLTQDTSINNVPTFPMVVSPANDTLNQPVNLTLQWVAIDDDPNDELTYDVSLYEGSQSAPVLMVEDIEENFVDVNDLKYGTTYLWQVTVKDGRSTPVFGMTWNFTTRDFPNHRYLFARAENGKYDIYSADGTGDEIRLTHNNGSNWRPLMSPNRDKIAFISNVGIEPQIYTMKRDGSDVQRITNLPISGFNNLELDFCWSPDGTKLLYMNNTMLYLINRDGAGLTPLVETPTGQTFVECDWTAQGNMILARTVGGAPYISHIWLIDSNGNYLQDLITNQPGNTGGGVFSINATKVLFTRDISGFEAADGRQLNARIFQIDINSNVRVDLSYNKIDGTNDLDARYSPDGAKIIFTNTNNDGISQKNIYTMNLDGTTRTLLFENAEMPDWR